MRINKTTGHAIRIMLSCARHEGRLIKAATLSEELGISVQNVLKIIHLLTHQDLIAATRGRNGGVQLAHPARDINIGAIVRAMETMDIDDAGDVSVAMSHPDLAPDVANLLDDAMLAFISVLEKHSLAEIAALQSRKSSAKSAARNAGRPSRKPAARGSLSMAAAKRRGAGSRRSSELE